LPTRLEVAPSGVILKADGISDFDRLHSRRHDGAVHLLGER
jgi:hypothetical protein